MKISSNGVLITPSIQKYLDIIASGEISENQMIAMKSLIGKNKDARQLIESTLKGKQLTLSAEQNKKAITFLLNEWKTPRGIERKNNPFSKKEQSILSDFSHFTLVGFVNIGNHSDFPFFVPLYTCYNSKGLGFEYYYNGEIVIGKTYIKPENKNVSVNLDELEKGISDNFKKLQNDIDDLY